MNLYRKTVFCLALYLSVNGWMYRSKSCAIRLLSCTSLLAGNRGFVQQINVCPSLFFSLLWIWFCGPATHRILLLISRFDNSKYP